MKKTKTFVIIGNSAAGLSAIESIRSIDSDSKIINISFEPHRPYSRCVLSYYLAGQVNKERLWLRPESYYKDYNIQPLLDTVVEKIDVKNKKLKVKQNKKTDEINYDKLLFATGASPKKVQTKGADLKGVFYLRTLDDADNMLSILGSVKDVAILGGGLIGMRAAYSLTRRNKTVRVFVKSSHIFSQMLDSESADILRRHLENNGIKIYTGVEAKQILGDGAVKGVILDDNTEFPAQMVIIGKGVSSNLELLKGQVKSEYGILVDEYLKTSNPDIYAAGDVAQSFDIFEETSSVNAIWPAAVRQGRIAGLNMTEKTTRYEGSYSMNSVDFFGLSAISFGIVKPQKEAGFEELIGAEFKNNIYRKFVLKNNRIVGGILVNDVEKHGIFLNLAIQKIDVSSIKPLLADEYFDYAKLIPLIKDQIDKFKPKEYQDTTLTYEPLFCYLDLKKR